MSEKVLQVIDYASSKNLQAMLEAIQEAGEEELDFSLAARARIEQEKLRLGLSEGAEKPEDFQENKSKYLLRIRSKKFHLQEAEKYKRHGNFRAAATAYRVAEDPEAAIEMCLMDNTPEYIDRAARIALGEGVNPQLGIDLRIKRGGVYHAFQDLSKAISSGKIENNQRQKWGEYIVKNLYKAVVDRIRGEIEELTGKRPEGETIVQILEGRKDAPGTIDTNMEDAISEAISYANSSSDPETIQAGLELLYLDEFSRRVKGRHDAAYYADKQIVLRGRLPEFAEKSISYLLSEAEKTLQDGFSSDFCAKEAVKLLRYHGRTAEALDAAERLLEPDDPERLGLIQSLGDLPRLANVYRQAGKAIEYAHTLAKIENRS